MKLILVTFLWIGQFSDIIICGNRTTYLIEPYSTPSLYIGTNSLNNQAVPVSNGQNFFLEKGLNGVPHAVSFKISENSSKYLFHYDYVLTLDVGTGLPNYNSDTSFMLFENKYFPGYIAIESTNYPKYFLRLTNNRIYIDPEKESEVYKKEASFKIIETVPKFGPEILKVVDVSSYAVNITLKDTDPTTWEDGVYDSQYPYFIKYKTPNNLTVISNLSKSSITLYNLQSFTTYEFFPAVKNQFGLGVYGSGFIYQTAKDDKQVQFDVNLYGFVEGNILTLSLEIIGYGYNFTFEYFLPPNVIFAFESDPLAFVKSGPNRHKYIFPDRYTLASKITHNITMTLIKTKCPQFGKNIIDIPVKLSFQNSVGALKILTKLYQNSLDCIQIGLPIISKDNSALPESYGRGIYWNTESSNIYVCMNQHVDRTKPACYNSNNVGLFWEELDVCVGSVLGHHSVTNELYAIHRNQKTYLRFRSIYKKWFALTVQQFKEIAFYLNSKMRKNLEGDEPQVYTLGAFQWMGNIEGLFYRNNSASSWSSRVKWFP